MKTVEFSVASIRNHRDGIHMPRVMFDEKSGALILMGRSIPVIDAEQLLARLELIGCDGGVAKMIVSELFGFGVSAETPVAVTELSENSV